MIKPYSGYDEQGRQILRMPTTVNEYDLRGDEDAVLFLGMPKEFNADWLPLPKSVKTVVVGGARWGPIQKVVDKVIQRAKALGFEKQLDFMFDFSNMVGPEYPEISSNP